MTESTDRTMADKIVAELERQGMSLRMLAAETHIAEPTLRRKVKGTGDGWLINLGELKVIAEVLNVEPVSLLPDRLLNIPGLRPGGQS